MDFSTSERRNIITVSKLNRLARSILESEIGQVWLSAEISNFVRAASGHWYFTLKDDRAQIKAAMFRGANSRLKVLPKEGDKVLVRGTVGVYEARGDYQMVADYLELDGEGLLKQQFEALKIKLAALGLFDQAHKKPLPQSVKRVGVVTSSTGAALHDILTVLKRRNPAIEVIVYPTMVQGNTAASTIIKAIDIATTRNEVDVLIVGRGGGSLEDLWCFNDEQLARAIFACPIPIVSAVGHEIDVTIADFVADVRAPTPSAAAELVSHDNRHLLTTLVQLQNRLQIAMRQHLSVFDHRLQRAQQDLKLTHPKQRIEQQYQHLDRLTLALQQRTVNAVERAKSRWTQGQHRLSMRSPMQSIQAGLQQNRSLNTRLEHAMGSYIKQQGMRLAKSAQLLDTVSPLATLTRGYSISFQNDQIVKRVADVTENQSLVTLLQDGKVISTVEKIEKN